MKKIAIITMGVKLDGEKGYTRFRYLSEFLVGCGYEVELITTTFQHWEKKQRDIDAIKREDYPFGLKFIYEPGYKKNIDLRRVKSHKIAAKNLKEFLNRNTYDLIYAEIPPNDVALAAAEYANEKHIPFVCDVNDLWPEAMRMVLDIPVVSDILFHSLKKDAESVYSRVSGVVGTSDEYRDRPFLNKNEASFRNIPRVTVYVGNEIKVFDAGIEKYAADIVKPEGEFWVGYAGTIGTSYDIKTMLLAAEEVTKRGYRNIKFKILGDGPLKDELEHFRKEKNLFNVIFEGYMDYDKMAAYLSKCDVLVNSFVKKAPQSIVTKIGDYLAAGKPMINTCMSPEFRSKVENDGFGVNTQPENMKALTDTIIELNDAPEKCAAMGEKARKIAKEQFDRPNSYKKIEQLIHSLLTERV